MTCGLFRLAPAFAGLALSACALDTLTPEPAAAPASPFKTGTPGAYALAGPAYGPDGFDSQGRASFAQGDVAGAEASFGQAVDVNPFDPIALNNLAVAKTEAGQFHEALGLLERASRLAPQNTEVAANLARLRAWNQNYSLQDGSTLGQASMDLGTFKNLPPDPPLLWDTRTER